MKEGPDCRVTELERQQAEDRAKIAELERELALARAQKREAFSGLNYAMGLTPMVELEELKRYQAEDRAAIKDARDFLVQDVDPPYGDCWIVDGTWWREKHAAAIARAMNG